MAQKNTYITTTLPYVNSDPHIGFALELVQADIYARYRQLTGDDVFFNTGTDEHGIKIFRKAEELGKDTQAYVDEGAEKFRKLAGALGLLPFADDAVSGATTGGGPLHFIRTSSPHHKAAAQEFWRLCDAAGDIYKKAYKIKYCVGCELEKTDSELVDGKCPLHPNLQIEVIDEENYFFRFSNYQKPLLDLYALRPDFVVPDFRFNEIRAFVERGLEDFSISRLKSKMSWGVEVPNDPSQVMYVWFDALVSYISTLGWPESAKGASADKNCGGKSTTDGKNEFSKWWPVLQFAGKDQIRQQAAMWQAMLMSARTQAPELEPSRQIFIHGFINSGGQKMSKSLGNVIDPLAVIAEYSTVTDFAADALRYYLAREIHPFEDSDFTMEKFKDAYNANLANGLGNLVSRILKLTTTYKISDVTFISKEELWRKDGTLRKFSSILDSYGFNEAADFVWNHIGTTDGTIQKTEPFKKLKDPAQQKEGIEIMKGLLQDLWMIAVLLEPILPDTAQAVQKLLTENKMPDKPLFMRKD